MCLQRNEDMYSTSVVKRWAIKDLQMWEIALGRGLNWCTLGGHFAIDNVRKSVSTLIEKRQLYALPPTAFRQTLEKSPAANCLAGRYKSDSNL